MKTALIFGLVAVCLWLQPAAALTIERVISPQGIEAWLVEDHSNPIIATQFSFAVGTASDPEGEEGLATMAANLLDEGAGDFDSQAFQGKLDDLAVSLSFGSSLDHFSGQMKTLSENRDQAFDLLRLALTAPRFDDDAVARVRAQTIAALQEEEQEPQAVVGRAFSAQLFPDHPYGRSSSIASVKAVTIADLKAWPATHLARDRLVIGVVGDITPQQLTGLLDRSFAGLPTHVELPPIADIAPPAKGETTVIHRDIPQSVVLFGEQGVKRTDQDWYKAYVMNYIFAGGGFSSRLMTEVRVKRGLAYGIEMSLSTLLHASLIEGEVATRNDKVGASLSVIKEQMRRMAATDVTAEELRSAKTYLNGAFPLQMDSTASIAGLLVRIQQDNLGIDYVERRAGLIESVTAADIRHVAGRLLDPEALTITIIGDPQSLPDSKAE